MSYATIHIPASRVEVDACLTPKSAEEAHRQLFEDALRIAKNRATRAAYNQVFAAYIRDAASDGFREGEWRYEEGPFRFAFPDHGESSMSMAASLHFMEVGAALLAENSVPQVRDMALFRRASGWQLTPTRNAREVLNHNEHPLIELGKTLYVIGNFEGEFYLSTDEGLPTLEWSDLPSAEQFRLEAMWWEKTCGCQLCDYYRPRAAKAEAEAQAKKAT